MHFFVASLIQQLQITVYTLATKRSVMQMVHMQLTLITTTQLAAFEPVYCPRANVFPVLGFHVIAIPFTHFFGIKALYNFFFQKMLSHIRTSLKDTQKEKTEKKQP